MWPQGHIIRGSLKLFPGSFSFWIVQNGTSLNQHSLQNSPLRNYTPMLAIVKDLWKPFQLFRRILAYLSSITKALYLLYWFQSREHVNISCSQMGMLQSCHTAFAKKILHRNRPVCWSIVVKEKKIEHSFSNFRDVSFWEQPWGDKTCHCTEISAKQQLL